MLLVQKYGFNPNLAQGYTGPNSGGNQLAMQLVMDALKLQPANPSFSDARNAILAADQALTGGANQYEIWSAFARRGMGFSFNDGGSSASTTVTQAFDLPPILFVQVFIEPTVGITADEDASLDGVKVAEFFDGTVSVSSPPTTTPPPSTGATAPSPPRRGDRQHPMRNRLRHHRRRQDLRRGRQLQPHVQHHRPYKHHDTERTGTNKDTITNHRRPASSPSAANDIGVSSTEGHFGTTFVFGSFIDTNTVRRSSPSGRIPSVNDQLGRRRDEHGHGDRERRGVQRV